MVTTDNVAVTPQLLGLKDAGFIDTSLPEPSVGTLDSALAAIGSALSHVAPPEGTTTSLGPFPAIYSFGGSLSDAGNVSIATLGFIPVSPPYSDGRFTNGQVWVQDLAQYVGLSPLKPSLAGGTDFAFGGAETGTVGTHIAIPADLPGQFAQFLIQDPSPSPNALYAVATGNNDILSILGESGQTPARAYAEIATAVSNEVSFLAALGAHGAKDFMVLNVPDLGKTPYMTARGPAASGAASLLSAVYDADLSTALGGLTAAGAFKVDLIDTFGLLDGVIANPAPFGFTNVTSPVWTGNLTSASSGTLNATTPAAQNQYLFWDDLHPTAQGHALLAQYAALTIGSTLG